MHNIRQPICIRICMKYNRIVGFELRHISAKISTFRKKILAKVTRFNRIVLLMPITEMNTIPVTTCHTVILSHIFPSFRSFIFIKCITNMMIISQVFSMFTMRRQAKYIPKHLKLSIPIELFSIHDFDCCYSN